MNLTPEQLKDKMDEYVATLSDSKDSIYTSYQAEGSEFASGFIAWLTAPPPLTLPTSPLVISSNDASVVLADGFVFCHATTINNARLVVAAVNAYIEAAVNAYIEAHK